MAWVSARAGDALASRDTRVRPVSSPASLRRSPDECWLRPWGRHLALILALQVAPGQPQADLQHPE